MKPKLKALKAWVTVDAAGESEAVTFDTRRSCRDYCNRGEVPVRVVVRSSEDDAAREAKIRRLRRALRIAKSYESGWQIAWGVGGVVDQYRTEHDLPDSGYLRTEDGRCACNVCVGVKRRWDEIARNGGAK